MKNLTDILLMYTLLNIIYNFFLFSKLNVIAWYNIIPYYNLLIKKFSVQFYTVFHYFILLYPYIILISYPFKKKYINKNWSRMASM